MDIISELSIWAQSIRQRDAVGGGREDIRQKRDSRQEKDLTHSNRL